MTPTDLVKNLRQQAQEIADENHAGWGNTMQMAADQIERLEAALELAAGAKLRPRSMAK